MKAVTNKFCDLIYLLQLSDRASSTQYKQSVGILRILYNANPFVGMLHVHMDWKHQYYLRTDIIDRPHYGATKFMVTTGKLQIDVCWVNCHLRKLVAGLVSDIGK